MRNLKNRLIRHRDDIDRDAMTPYRESDIALTWLVLFEISKMTVELPESFQHVLDTAFDRTSEALREGHIALDYAPHSPQVFEMPEPRHPLYMQALLYWATKFDCGPAVLVDAYARLGRAAPVASGYLIVSSLKDDDEDRTERFGGSTMRPADQPSTLPLFVATLPA